MQKQKNGYNVIWRILNIKNMKTDFEKYIRDLFEHYGETPPAECWSKLSNNLDKLSNTPPPSSDVSSIFTQIVKSSFGKIGIGIAVVGSITTTVLLLTNDTDTDVKHITPNPIVENIPLPSTTNENVKEIDFLVDETAIPYPTETEHHTTNKQTTDIHKESSKEEKDKNSLQTNKPIGETAMLAASEPVSETKQAVEKKMPKADEKPIRQTPSMTSEPKTTQKPIQVSEEKIIPHEIPETINESEENEEEIRQPIFHIPNIISPNGDNVNDYFEMELLPEIESSQLYIYSIQGKVLYHKKDYRNEFNGEHLPDGVYLYIYKFIYKGN